MWTILILIGTIIFLVWWLSSPFYWRKRNAPYLLPLPVIGNLLPMLKYGSFEYAKVLYKMFPGESFYGLHFFIRPALVVKDPELIQRILVTDFEHFTSRGFYGNQDRDPAGGNLFHTYGQQWKELRGKLSQYFTPSKVKGMLIYADKTIKKAMEVIDRDISNNRPTDMLHLMTNVTLDVSNKSFFGNETDAFSSSGSDYYALFHEALAPPFALKFFLGIISTKMYDLLKLTIFGDKANRGLAEIVGKTIEYRRKENVRNMNDFLEGMMELMDNYEEPKEKYFPDGTRVPRYDFKSLLGQALMLLSGATETSAATMTFLLYELSLHPEIQERCREEVNAVAKESGGQISVGDLSKLVYLGAAIQEILRMYPPLAIMNRECTRDYRIPGTDVTIEKGTILMLLTNVQMDPKYHPDPDVFNPDRYLDGNKFLPGTYLPFAIGPRICLGMGLANNEMKFVVSRLLQRYEFSVCSKTDIPVKLDRNSFVRKPVNGMILNIAPVSSS